MSEKITSRTCEEQDLDRVKQDLATSGYTVTDVERTENKDDNSVRYRVTGKDFNAKLGYADREFVD